MEKWNRNSSQLPSCRAAIFLVAVELLRSIIDGRRVSSCKWVCRSISTTEKFVNPHDRHQSVCACKQVHVKACTQTAIYLEVLQLHVEPIVV